MTEVSGTETVAGSCFCGAVAFEIDLPTVACVHCHCSMCRRPHGASYVTWAVVRPGQLRIRSPAEHLKTYQSSTYGRRQFCATCGSQLFCWHEGLDGSPPKVIDVALAALHCDIDRLPQAHYFYDSRARWTEVHDALPKLGGPSGAAPLDAAD
jgi:hypothetical protein